MKNRIGFTFFLFTLFFHADCFSFYHYSASSDTCLGEIELERIDTVKINTSLPYYRFHSMSRQGCYSCDIYVGDGTEALQHIVKVNLDSTINEVRNAYVDINFDGFRDLLIIFLGNSTLYINSEYWLFNQESGHFEFSQKYTDLISGKTSIEGTYSDQWNSWQLHYMSKPNYGLRCAFDIDWKISDTRFSYGLGIPPIAISKSESDKEIRIASNYLVIAPGFILNSITHDRVYAMFFRFNHWITKFTFVL